MGENEGTLEPVSHRKAIVAKLKIAAALGPAVRRSLPSPTR